MMRMFAGAQVQKTVTWGVKSGMSVSNVAEAYKGETPQGMSEGDCPTG